MFTGVGMSVDVCVTRMKGLNNKNSINQEDKKLLLKLLFKICISTLFHSVAMRLMLKFTFSYLNFI